MTREELKAAIESVAAATGLPVVYVSSVVPSMECSARRDSDVLAWAEYFNAAPTVRVEVQNLTRTIRQDLYVSVPVDGQRVMIRYRATHRIVGGLDTRLVVVTP